VPARVCFGNKFAAMLPFATPIGSTLTPSGSPKRFLRILYADDLRELRDVVRISLSREGHGIECVEDGLLGLARVTADPTFDLVITDHHMPNMNGLELVTRLREQVFAGKIMVFSSELSAAIAAEYQRLKVDRILYKPVYPSVLRQTLRELFPLAAHREPGESRAPYSTTTYSSASPAHHR
jgi:two-component system, chemotaxis family, chemotaxis protein CheY